MPKFCSECGTPLPEGAKFCSECGEPMPGVEQPSTPSTPQALVPSGGDSLTLPLLGNTVCFDRSITAYRALRWEFEALARQEATDFYENFYQAYSSMDAFMSKFPGNFQGIFQRAIERMDAWLASIEVFGVTQNELEPYVEQYCAHAYAIFETVEEQYGQILGQQEAAEQYRRARKASRGKVAGFGFGLGGYVKAAATAGAINMTTGLLHSAVNAVGNLGTAISTSSAKEKLLRSGIDHKLRNAIFQDIMGVHQAATELAADRRHSPMVSFTLEDNMRAQEIQQKLEDGQIPPTKWKSAVISLLTADPFYAPGYHTAMKLFPGRLEEMREFFAFFEEDVDKLYGTLREQGDAGVRVLLEYEREFTPLLLGDLGYDEDPQPLTSDLDGLLNYLSDIFSWADEDGFYFEPEATQEGSSLLQRVRYAAYGQETPLILYDAVPERSGTEGFLITQQAVYIKSPQLDTVRVPLAQALESGLTERRDEEDTPYLYFGEYSVLMVNSGAMVHERVLSEFLRFAIAAILFLSNYRPTEKDLWKAVAEYQRLPQPAIGTPSLILPAGQPAVRYCFECGTENSVTDRFCIECGAELI